MVTAADAAQEFLNNTAGTLDRASKSAARETAVMAELAAKAQTRREELRMRLIEKAIEILPPAEQTGAKVVEEAEKMLAFVNKEEE